MEIELMANIMAVVGLTVWFVWVSRGKIPDWPTILVLIAFGMLIVVISASLLVLHSTLPPARVIIAALLLTQSKWPIPFGYAMIFAGAMFAIKLTTSKRKN